MKHLPFRTGSGDILQARGNEVVSLQNWTGQRRQSRPASPGKPYLANLKQTAARAAYRRSSGKPVANIVVFASMSSIASAGTGRLK